jgi:hypothetical protein
MPYAAVSALPPLLAEEVNAELARAEAKFKPYNSAHEGYAVVLEELDELWDEVKKNGKARDVGAMRAEAIQVAVTALRFVKDVCDRKASPEGGA